MPRHLIARGITSCYSERWQKFKREEGCSRAVIVIAHRGANKEAFENSWTAFEAAVHGGADRIELDVHLTADKKCAILHDQDLRHAARVHKQISELTAAELTSLTLPDGKGIPMLPDVMESLLPRVELNIEIKGADLLLTRTVAELVSQHSLKHKVILSCFELEPLLFLRDHYPQLQRACLWGDDHLPWPFFGHLSPQIFLGECQTHIFHPRADLVDENLMDQAHHRGWKVFTWSPMVGEEHQREDLWTILKTLGVHGHCTNYPREMKAWLQEAEQYVPSATAIHISKPI